MCPQNNVIVIATRNQGKVREFAALFAEQGFKVRSLADYSELPPIEETGATFAENARIKAQIIAAHLHVPVLADDSGLCVDSLSGAPGVYSARYAGEGATDEANNAKLLEAARAATAKGEASAAAISAADAHTDGAAAAVPGGAARQPRLLSRAAFVCALAFVDPVANRLLEVEERCDGYIADEPRGAEGFGYDPLFYLPELGKTMAELTPQEKNAVSHRAKALRSFMQQF